MVVPCRGQRSTRIITRVASIDEEQHVETELRHDDDSGVRSSSDSSNGNGSARAGRSQGFALDNKQLAKLGELENTDTFTSGIISSAQDLADKLCVDPATGLLGTEEDNAARERQFGANRLAARDDTTFLELIIEAANDVTVLVLLGAGILSLVLGLAVEGGDSWIEGAAIMAAVIVVVMVTAVNNFQKEKQFRELNKITEDITVRVLRSGAEASISTYDLLVGDVMLVDTGDILPADGILFKGNDLRMDESHLTGEADDRSKSPDGAAMMFSGSKVLEGAGRMLVTAVGPNSQQGLISSMVAGAAEDLDGLRQTTQLQRKLDAMAGQIGTFGLAAALVSLLGMAVPFTYNTFVVAGTPWNVSFLGDYLHFLIQAITILVVAVPEGLPLAVTIALAFSVKRMLADANLVRNLGAAETMGCATTICTDKTGTLTCNEMAVVRLWLGGKDHRDLQRLPFSPRPEANPLGLADSVRALLTEGIALNSSANLEASSDAPGGVLKVGNRTECALLQLVESLGDSYAALRQDSQPRLLRVLPFSSDRKRMSTLTALENASSDGANARLFVKGAAEIILDRCKSQLDADGTAQELQDFEKGDLLRNLSTEGLRMIALAYRDVTVPGTSDRDVQALDPAELESKLTLVAMVGIEDPIRPEVPAAIDACHRAGISVRMLTGDNATTGSAIARQCGILPEGCAVFQPAGQDELLRELESMGASGRALRSGIGDESRVSGASGSSLLASASGVTDSAIDSILPSDLTGKPQEEFLVLDGPDFRRAVLDADGKLQQAVFDKLWPRLRVLARCSPADKYTIVKGLQANPNEVVAMTGDGTNDAPALRLADVGFAMNIGTSIAKEASDILLMDNNFSSIVSAVKWGRNVYAGIMRFLQFQLTINAVAIVTACAGSLALQESPLTAVQMLWVNLIMDSLASLSLATDAPTDDMLDLPPYRSDQPLITPTLWRNIAGQAVFQLGVMYALVTRGDVLFGVPNHAALAGAPSEHYTIVFNAFVLMQLFNQVNARKIYDEPNVLDGILENKLFVGILASELILQAVIVQFGGEAFMTHPLNWQQWGACIGVGALGLVVREALLLLRLPEKTKS